MQVIKKDEYLHVSSEVPNIPGESVIYYKNCIVYIKDGKLHREFGPSIYYIDGSLEMYYQNGVLHSLHNASIIHLKNGNKYFYINGVFLYEEEWNKKVPYLKTLMGDLL